MNKATASRPKIFQIYYRDDQRQMIDPAFTPYDNKGKKDPLLEFSVFRDIFRSGATMNVPMWGALSWKFSQKTGLSGDELLAIVEQNPGFDLYYCNPFPEVECLYHNLWVQGETSHPDFIALSEKVFRAAGLSPSFITEIAHSSSFSTTNYFVASNRFWVAYIAFVEDVCRKVGESLTKDELALLYSATADAKGVHAGATYMPFVVERLLPVFLRTAGRWVRAFKYGVRKQQPENVHLALLRSMKDRAVESGDRLMAVCWVNYRNLYLEKMHGPKWVRQYLPLVTPVSVVFGEALSCK